MLTGDFSVPPRNTRRHISLCLVAAAELSIILQLLCIDSYSFVFSPVY
jgi:hypothetical protein